jgi:hypothetical protein
MPFLALVPGDEQAVYADRGYDGWWYRQELASRACVWNIEVHIESKAGSLV